MPGYARILNTGERPLFGERITVTDTARLHFDPDRPWARLRYVPLDDFKGPVRARDLHNTHFRHGATSLVQHFQVSPQSCCRELGPPLTNRCEAIMQLPENSQNPLSWQVTRS